MPNISALGGIETYVYELVKKYKDLDIAVVCKKIERNQKRRLQKMCPVYVHQGEIINCKICLINYDQTIIDYITPKIWAENAKEDEGIYQVFHADYSTGLYEMPEKDPRVKGHIAITKYQQKKMGEILNTKMMLSYNPLTIEEEKPIVIVTASRLYENKGTKLMQEFANKMDESGVKWLWIILTCDKDVIKSPNVVFLDNRLDVDKFLSMATYVALFSKAECCSYTLNEALFRNIPILVTPLPYLQEIGVKDGENAYILEHDGSNLDEVVKKITKVPKFTFKRFEDSYGEIFSKDKSHYKPTGNVKVVSKGIPYYGKLDRSVEEGEVLEVTEAEAERLINLNFVEEV